jgi:hypothetical protein
MTTAEFTVANIAFAAAAVQQPVRRAMASAGLSLDPVAVARDAETVRFLRMLDLDPNDALGPSVVARADAWVADGGRDRLVARQHARRAGSRLQVKNVSPLANG